MDKKSFPSFHTLKRVGIGILWSQISFKQFIHAFFFPGFITLRILWQNYILNTKKGLVRFADVRRTYTTSERVWVSLERMIYSMYHQLRRNRDYWRRFSYAVTKAIRTLAIALVGQLSLLQLICLGALVPPSRRY